MEKTAAQLVPPRSPRTALKERPTASASQCSPRWRSSTGAGSSAHQGSRMLRMRQAPLITRTPRLAPICLASQPRGQALSPRRLPLPSWRGLALLPPLPAVSRRPSPQSRASRMASQLRPRARGREKERGGLKPLPAGPPYPSAARGGKGGTSQRRHSAWSPGTCARRGVPQGRPWRSCWPAFLQAWASLPTEGSV